MEAKKRGVKIIAVSSSYWQEEIPVEKAAGRILADAHVGCPPCIPIIAAGERIDQAAMACFCYYGVESCSVVLEK